MNQTGEDCGPGVTRCRGKNRVVVVGLYCIVVPEDLLKEQPLIVPHAVDQEEENRTLFTNVGQNIGRQYIRTENRPILIAVKPPFILLLNKFSEVLIGLPELI